MGRGIPGDRDRVIPAVFDIAEVDQPADYAHLTVGVEGAVIGRDVIKPDPLSSVETDRDGVCDALITKAATDIATDRFRLVLDDEAESVSAAVTGAEE